MAAASAANIIYVCAYNMHMVKVISLSEYAYALLKARKKVEMSFSDVVASLVREEKEEKTKDLPDLIAWAESFPKTKKKTNWSLHIDEIAYGVKRP